MQVFTGTFSRTGKVRSILLIKLSFKISLTCYYSDSKVVAENIRFPNRESCIGGLINSYLQSSSSDINDNTIHLLFSANRWEAKDSMLQKLEAGVSLVCDRYAYSGVAFSSAKGMDMEWCCDCDRGLPAPDCVIYLDMPVEDAAKVYILFFIDILLFLSYFYREVIMEKNAMKKWTFKRKFGRDS